MTHLTTAPLPQQRKRITTKNFSWNPRNRAPYAGFVTSITPPGSLLRAVVNLRPRSPLVTRNIPPKQELSGIVPDSAPRRQVRPFAPAVHLSADEVGDDALVEAFDEVGVQVLFFSPIAAPGEHGPLAFGGADAPPVR